MSKTTCSTDVNRPPLRVFLVEDSLDVRELMMENLAMIPGVVVAGVSESEGDALSQLSEMPCDVLIVDIQLKKGNGISLLRQISEGDRVSGTLKIICSNNASEVFRRAGQQYGVRHFFDKTSEFPQLFALLKDLSGTDRAYL
ncbi:MAG TPA: response regulator [Oxalicibacterium sp.]|jgi:response regulator of citrate/malate metabolism|nr:response regulator [Oxalicibacterium sp.]